MGVGVADVDQRGVGAAPCACMVEGELLWIGPEMPGTVCPALASAGPDLAKVESLAQSSVVPQEGLESRVPTRVQEEVEWGP